MVCTKEEFKNTVWARFPTRWINEIKSSGRQILFVLDTSGGWQHDKITKYRLASHIWENGRVVKDTTGLFTGVSTTSTSSAGQSSAPNTFVFNIPHTSILDAAALEHSDSISRAVKWDKGLEIRPKVCQCGKEKHGFAKHSDWCDIKETF
jgi:hypothetical protein